MEDIEISWEHGAWDCGTAEYSKKDDGEMKDEMERIFMGGRKPCEETGQKGESLSWKERSVSFGFEHGIWNAWEVTVGVKNPLLTFL